MNLLLRDPSAGLAGRPFVLTPMPGMFIPESGEGATRPSGKNAGKIIDIITSPEFIRKVDGGAFERHMAAAKKEMAALGAIGKTTGALGMSKSGDYKWDGDCPQWLLLWLQHLDPELFTESGEKRLTRILQRIGGHVDERVK